MKGDAQRRARHGGIRGKAYRGDLSIGVGPVLRVAGGLGRVIIVGGGQPLEILARHAAANDAGQCQDGAVDTLPCPNIGFVAVRSIIVISRNDPAWFIILALSMPIPVRD